MSRSDNNKQRGSSAPDFESLVFPGELEQLKTRSSAATRPDSDPCGLPDLEAALGPEAARSAFFSHTLELLRSDEQDRLWHQHADADPTARHAGLTGLALSGGGIRSAALSLGIVQVLHRIGLFRCFDYLSTVSGGGYLGSSITSCYTEPAKSDPDEKARASSASEVELKAIRKERLRKAADAFPYRHVAGEPEGAAFRQLRNHSRFLVPTGLIDYVKLPALLVRGILINFLVIVPWIIGAAIVSHWFMNRDATWRWSGLVSVPIGGPFVATLVLLGLFLAVSLFFPIARRLRYAFAGGKRAMQFRNTYERFMAWVLVFAMLTAWIELQPLVIAYVKNFRGFTIGHTAVALGGTGALLASGGQLLARNLRSILSRYGLYFVALVGFAGFWLIYIALVIWLTPALGTLTASPPLGMSVQQALLGILVVLFVYTNLAVDANGLSLHNFYRDRLSDAFIFRIDETTGQVDNSIDPKLSDLATSGVGPLHLINTTLNTKQFPEDFRKGRQAEPFLLSPLYFGSRITGYGKTTELEALQNEVRLSTAVATSGAAVSSIMGTLTTPVMRLILSVLNIRLGYWLVNPRATETGSAGSGYGTGYRVGRHIRAGVVRYLQELLGAVSFRTSYLYLSDGGHIENIGLYELVRRQCRLIVVGDGECDPQYNFNGLMDALRLIRTDFGYVIEMEGLDEIRCGEQQFARGTIYYGDGRIGYLIYLKSSLLGDDMIEATVSQGAYVTSPLRSDGRRYDEFGDLAQYKSLHADFPHESTADQFFDEIQFESYRALGYQIAKRALVSSA